MRLKRMRFKITKEVTVADHAEQGVHTFHRHATSLPTRSATIARRMYRQTRLQNAATSLIHPLAQVSKQSKSLFKKTTTYAHYLAQKTKGVSSIPSAAHFLPMLAFSGPRSCGPFHNSLFSCLALLQVNVDAKP
jgi:hypothetical protein